MSNEKPNSRIGGLIEEGSIEDLIGGLEDTSGQTSGNVPDVSREQLQSIIEGSLRKPRIVIVGPANSGKSTFINLLFGATISEVRNIAGQTRGAKVEEHDALGVVLVDTPGFDVNDTDDAVATEWAHNADLVILLMDMRNLAGGRRVWNKFTAVKVPVLAVFNKADMLTQKEMAQIQDDLDRWGVPEPRLMTSLVTGWNLAEVLGAIRKKLPPECGPAFVGWLSNELDAAKQLRAQIADEARKRFDEAKTEAERRAAVRWKEEEIAQAETRAREISIDSRDDEADSIILTSSLAAAGISVLPIPLVDVPASVGAMVHMLTRLAAVYGYPGGVSAIMARFGGALAGAGIKKIVSSIAGFIPVLGQVIDVTITFASCYALGKTAKAFFKRTIGPGQLKQYADSMKAEGRGKAERLLNERNNG